MKCFKPGDLVFYDSKTYQYSSRFPGSKEKFNTNLALIIEKSTAFDANDSIYDIFLNGKVQAVFVTNLRQID